MEIDGLSGEPLEERRGREGNRREEEGDLFIRCSGDFTAAVLVR